MEFTIGALALFYFKAVRQTMFPNDSSLGAPAGEVVNCRCVLEFDDGKVLTNSGERDIINTNEMFRRRLYSARENVKPVREEVFNALVADAKRKGANILKCKYGDEMFLHLERNNATASCIGDTLIFRPDATISEVLEELHHFDQNLSGLNDDKNQRLRTILNEIDAKQFVLDNSKRYAIPRNEIEEIQSQLRQYQQELEEYYLKG